MTWSLVALVLVVAAAGLLRWRRPAWYWLTFGVALASLRVLVRYASVMDACGLTVPPSRWRLALARATNRPVPGPRAPRILRLRPTRTGLVLRLGLRPGQDSFDVAASCDRLRHSFAMFGVTSRELRSGVVEVRMTGYDVLKRVQMPAKTDTRPMRVPVALREDGAVHYRDYRAVPHGLTLGATESGKSVYQRNVVVGLAPQRVALVGIDCKQGVELFPLARRFSALADDQDTAAELLDALVSHMQDVYQVIRAEQRITADVPDAEIAADIWDLPEHLRPVPIVVLVDEVAELALSTKKNDPRRDRIIRALVRLAQLGRAAGIYLEICGQRFGSELGDGITMLRAQLTGRTAHRVNDQSSANMAFGDIAPDAVLAAIQIPTDMPGVAITGDSTGGWARIRAPHTSLRQAVNICNRYADITPDLPALAPFRPALAIPTPVDSPAVESIPATA
ncbi:plasmid transfer protein [Streptomyces sp. SID4946]|uniref:FtsK/SpoIIIE domain-containing protein n=1 Tax=Streptomyces sp. LamerLS-31b TaxID=1839765 RepID=UPI00081D8150|nr:MULTISPECIES: FtsK/SpoIIIE domain-containing protein [unclassified Streptomyces]MYQ92210.1 plasmid transfer protein [Streptomyces sp. SID4946]SCF66659.1 DNA segregation ATPase FtsK/SpoIIIE, S-DNA-T family [Streptomyces sp. LamerLS-31b]SCF72800.1 DNA segregation ATPase FtsK/SpoIIIE, S-DNA-T family [Streptomyces sp. DconLS]